MLDLALSLSIAAVTDPAGPANPANPQRDVGRAFLLLTVLIIVGLLLVLGVVLAGFAYFARTNAAHPKRRDRHEGVDAWEESARRAREVDDEPEDDEDWEADDGPDRS